MKVQNRDQELWCRGRGSQSSGRTTITRGTCDQCKFQALALPAPRRPESGSIGWVRSSDMYIFPKLLWQRYRQGMTWEFCPHHQYPLAPPLFDTENACFSTLRKPPFPVLPT